MNKKLEKQKKKLINILDVNDTAKQVEAHNKDFRNKHKKMFLFCDIFVIVLIISNMGAMAITNALIIKEVPKEVELEFYEMNPITAETHDLPTNDQAKSEFVRWIKHILLLTALIFFYMTIRHRANNYLDLIYMKGAVTALTFIVVYDFIWDLGILAGVGLR